VGRWSDHGVRVGDLTPDSDPVAPFPRLGLADPTALTQNAQKPQKAAENCLPGR